MTPFFRQMRKKSGRPKDSGVIVRLLVDMKGFGKEGETYTNNTMHLLGQGQRSLY